MKVLVLFLLLIDLSTSLSQENKSELLIGQIISSEESSELLKSAFDGNPESEFSSLSKSHGWIGLELETAHRITKIGWMPKNGNSTDPKDYLLGVFEGSNEETFIKAFPLYMITKEGEPGKMNYVNIDMTYSFKYLRYVGPNGKYCVISGLEFYGYESSTNITKEEEKLYQPTNLPTVIIHTETGEDPRSKDNDISGNVIIVNKGKVDTKKKASVSLRGNSTSGMSKKPYKFKFEDKETVLDLPSKAKKWNLLANFADKTLIRNFLVLKISRLFKMNYTPSCTPVDVFLNGEYKGNYDLCEKIEVAKGRIEFPESKDDEENVEPSEGFLLEANSQTNVFYKTSKGLRMNIWYPDQDEITEEQREYIEDYFNEVEAESFDGIADKIDLDSFCKYILIGEFGSNPDIFFSTYMTKIKGDDKIYFGPVWDYDLGFGNDMRLFPALYNETFMFKLGNINSLEKMAVVLMNNEVVLNHLKDTWNEVTKTTMTKKVLIDFIDEQVKTIDQSQKLNFMRWDVLDKMIFTNQAARCSFEAEIEFLKHYIDVRFELLGKLLDKIDTSTVNDETNVPKTSGRQWSKWWGKDFGSFGINETCAEINP